VYVTATVSVLALGWGIGWVWAAFSSMQAVRFGTLVWRWQGDAWLVTGAER
jgi:Na+-driven multidrug efflux pump